MIGGSRIDRISIDFAANPNPDPFQVEALGEERVAMQPGQFVLSDVVLQMEGATPETYACDCYVAVGKTARLAVMTPAALNSMNEVRKRERTRLSVLGRAKVWRKEE